MLHSSWMAMEGGEKKRHKGRNFGHLKGVETVKKVVKASLKNRIPIISFYVFRQKLEKTKNRNKIIYLNSLKIIF